MTLYIVALGRTLGYIPTIFVSKLRINETETGTREGECKIEYHDVNI